MYHLRVCRGTETVSTHGGAVTELSSFSAFPPRTTKPCCRSADCVLVHAPASRQVRTLTPNHSYFIDAPKQNVYFFKSKLSPETNSVEDRIVYFSIRHFSFCDCCYLIKHSGLPPASEEQETYS